MLVRQVDVLSGHGIRIAYVLGAGDILAPILLSQRVDYLVLLFLLSRRSSLHCCQS